MKIGWILAGVLGAGAASASEQDAAWRYEESVDAMSDFARPRAIATAEGGALLAIACNRPGKGEVFVHIVSQEYLGGSGLNYASRPITYRFDDRAPVEDYWRYQDGSARAVKKAVARFIGGLAGAQRVTVRLQRYDRRTVDEAFAVAGADEMIEKVYSACGDVRP